MIEGQQAYEMHAGLPFVPPMPAWNELSAEQQESWEQHADEVNHKNRADAEELTA